jgi:hypothetical protein
MWVALGAMAPFFRGSRRQGKLVSAGPLAEAEAARKRGDYSTAFRLVRPLAELGDAAAQFSLGQMQANGQGVEKDYAEAIKWYRKAADQGHAEAQFYHGVMYLYGRGVPQDYFEAVKWYRKAAEQGLAIAEFSLGLRYAQGQGVPQKCRRNRLVADGCGERLRLVPIYPRVHLRVRQGRAAELFRRPHMVSQGGRPRSPSSPVQPRSDVRTRSRRRAGLRQSSEVV